LRIHKTCDIITKKKTKKRNMSVELEQIPTAETEIKQVLAESLDLPNNEQKSDKTLEFQLKLVRGEIIELAEEAAKPEEFTNTEQAQKTQEMLSKMTLPELTMTLKLMPKNPELLKNLTIILENKDFESGKMVETINKANEITPAQLTEIQKINDEAKAKLELDRANLETSYAMKSAVEDQSKENNPEYNRKEIFAKPTEAKDETELSKNDTEKIAEVDKITSKETKQFLLNAGGIKMAEFAMQMNEQYKLEPSDVAERVINGEEVGSPFFIELSTALEKMMMTPNTEDEKALQKIWTENSTNNAQKTGRLQNFREVVNSIRKIESTDVSKSKEAIELYGKIIQNLIYNFNGWKKPPEKR
jgi:hypothetical protein